MERLLTVEELSQKLQVGRSTIYRWVHYDYIPHVKLGSSVRFSESAVERWLKSKERSGRATLNIDVSTWEKSE
jgi:excisionase family DNA binding protein